jgi:hypothetical protein
MRFFAGCVAVAVAIRLIFVLLMPVLPELFVVCVAVALWRLWSWHRDQW